MTLPLPSDFVRLPGNLSLLCQWLACTTANINANNIRCRSNFLVSRGALHCHYPVYPLSLFHSHRPWDLNHLNLIHHWWKREFSSLMSSKGNAIPGKLEHGKPNRYPRGDRFGESINSSIFCFFPRYLDGMWPFRILDGIQSVLKLSVACISISESPLRLMTEARMNLRTSQNSIDLIHSHDWPASRKYWNTHQSDDLEYPPLHFLLWVDQSCSSQTYGKLQGCPLHGMILKNALARCSWDGSA